MEKAEIVRRVTGILSKVQKISGRKTVAITGQTRPIGGLPDFDSLNGVEASVLIAQEFSIEFPRSNILVNDSGTAPLSVSQIADYVGKSISK